MTDTLQILQEFYREKLAALQQHHDHARVVGQYDANNTYQYIINRDEVQLSWLANAIADSGGTLPEASGPSSSAPPNGKPGAQPLVEADARDAHAFVERWRPRVDAMTNARQARMLRVILGEALEQQRFFEQALAGRTDLLGKRSDAGEPAHGKVLPGRWIE